MVNDTEAALQQAGRRGDELFLFWSGVIERNAFKVQTLHRPTQRCRKSPRGLSVHIDGGALHDQARWLAEHRELLGVQIHTHPEDAYHSEADDEHAAVTLTGAVSIVVPDFARRAVFDLGTSIFRLYESGWNLVDPSETAQLFRVTD
jgi:hypothetical protein